MPEKRPDCIPGCAEKGPGSSKPSVLFGKLFLSLISKTREPGEKNISSMGDLFVSSRRQKIESPKNILRYKERRHRRCTLSSAGGALESTLLGAL